MGCARWLDVGWVETGIDCFSLVTRMLTQALFSLNFLQLTFFRHLIFLHWNFWDVEFFYKMNFWRLNILRHWMFLHWIFFYIEIKIRSKKNVSTRNSMAFKIQSPISMVKNSELEIRELDGTDKLPYYFKRHYMVCALLPSQWHELSRTSCHWNQRHEVSNFFQNTYLNFSL